MEFSKSNKFRLLLIFPGLATKIFTEAVSASCTECEVGKFGQGEKSDSCTKCKAGQFQNLLGQKDCNPCPTGKVSDAGSNTLVARLDNKSALTAYATHTEHLIVKAKIIAAIQPLLTTQENEIGTIIVPPVLALDYHSKRYPGTVPTKDIQDSLAVTHVVLICLRPNCNSKCASCRNLDQQLKQAAKEMAQGIPGIIDRNVLKKRTCTATYVMKHS